MTLTIYGPPQSRAMRTLWMAHELELDFRHERGFRDDAVIPTEALLAANPMGQVPAIDHDGFTLTESMAINIYLARKHGKLAPRSLEDEAQTLRWSFWVMTAVEVTLEGNSGGPVFVDHDDRYRLLGVMHAMSTVADDYGFVIKQRYVRELVNDALEKSANELRQEGNYLIMESLCGGESGSEVRKIERGMGQDRAATGRKRRSTE